MNAALIATARTNRDKNFGSFHWETMTVRNWKLSQGQSFAKDHEWQWTWASE